MKESSFEKKVLAANERLGVAQERLDAAIQTPMAEADREDEAGRGLDNGALRAHVNLPLIQRLMAPLGTGFTFNGDLSP